MHLLDEKNHKKHMQMYKPYKTNNLFLNSWLLQ